VDRSPPQGFLRQPPALLEQGLSDQARQDLVTLGESDHQGAPYYSLLSRASQSDTKL
jgi:hypothetical protein